MRYILSIRITHAITDPFNHLWFFLLSIQFDLKLNICYCKVCCMAATTRAPSQTRHYYLIEYNHWFNVYSRSFPNYVQWTVLLICNVCSLLPAYDGGGGGIMLLPMYTLINVFIDQFDNGAPSKWKVLVPIDQLTMSYITNTHTHTHRHQSVFCIWLRSSYFPLLSIITKNKRERTRPQMSQHGPYCASFVKEKH